jgi:peptidoglycan/LPS O-acetylase OafA/YrhL
LISLPDTASSPLLCSQTDGAITAPASRVVELDGLRGIAIGLVLGYHFAALDIHLPADAWPGWHFLYAPARLGWSGVTLFFVLSGYLIGGILMDNRNSPKLLRTFYLRRSLRILPLYFAFLLACGALFLGRTLGLAWMPDGTTAFSWWIYAGFLVNFAVARGNFGEQILSPTWSLSVEEQFYLVAPWVMLLVPRRGLPWIFAGLIALAAVFRAGLYAYIGGPNFGGHVLTPACMDALAAGMLVAWLVRSSAARTWLAANRALLLVCLGLFLAGGLALSAQNPSLGSSALVGYGYTTLVGGYALLLLTVVYYQPPLLSSILRTRWLVALGRIAYCVYLVHMLTLVVLETVATHLDLNGAAVQIGMRVLALLGTLLIANVSWRYFEEPLIRLGRRLGY